MKRWSTLIVTLYCLCFTLSVNGDDGQNKEKLLSNSIVDGVVVLRSDNYNKLAIETPRNYHLFLLFTATQERFGCSVCRDVGPEFTVLAESYLSAESSGKKASDGKKIFFATVEFEQNQGAFSLHGFSSAPHLVYVAPDDDPYVSTEDLTKLEFEPEQTYNIYQSGYKAESLVTFVKEKTGIQMEIYRSPVFKIMLLLVGFATILMAAKFVLSNLDFFLGKIRRRELWMFISLLFYGLSVSGMVYCIIREPLPYMTERSGKIKFFHPAGRQQFVFEGLIVGGFNVIAALSIITLTIACHVKSDTRRYLTLVCSLFGFWWAYYSLIASYTLKNSWYAHRQWY